jgi:hypothetical protein
MKYLIIDAYFGGTGIRDKYNGGYINPNTLFLSENFVSRLINWLKMYNLEFFNGFLDKDVIEKLDEEGKEIALQLIIELNNDAKVEYYSDAKMMFLTIPFG